MHKRGRKRQLAAAETGSRRPACGGPVRFPFCRIRFPLQPSSVVLIAFHKPYGVLSQFTPEPGSRWRTLAEFALPAGVYALGRLDADSEGLLLLSDEPGLNTRLLDPRHAHRREYWAQVERVPDDAALARLARGGIDLGGFTTQPCRTRRLDPAPALPPRDPPIRFRKNVSDTWIALELIEGKNRQVRRMTAAVGHPTLRLLRVRIGGFLLGDLAPGRFRELGRAEREAVFSDPDHG
jgi:23S rRNA pseudouridine2457 synthase